MSRKIAAFLWGRRSFEGGVHSRAAFYDIFACTWRLIEGGVYSREAFIRIHVITVIE